VNNFSAITPSNNQQITSSNPWNISNPTSSTSPAYANVSTNNQGSNLLYPTAASGINTSPSPSSLSTSRKTPESFLGDKFSTLVNLDQLVTDQRSMKINNSLFFILFSIFGRYESFRSNCRTYAKSIFQRE